MIYVVTGVMASGKSTVAELLAGRFAKSVHLRGDVFRRMIINGRADMSSTPSQEAFGQLNLRYRITALTAKTYAQDGFTVIVQDNYLGEQLEVFLAMLTPEPVQVIVLCPDADAVKAREAGRGKRGYTGFTVEELHTMFMETTPRIGLWIDSTHQTPDETVDAILHALQG